MGVLTWIFWMYGVNKAEKEKFIHIAKSFLVKLKK
jgi:hypothetical protein